MPLPMAVVATNDYADEAGGAGGHGSSWTVRAPTRSHWVRAIGPVPGALLVVARPGPEAAAAEGTLPSSRPVVPDGAPRSARHANTLRICVIE